MTMSYSYPNYIEYCEKKNNSIRTDKDILWYNNIPVPQVLMKKVFFSAEEFLHLYAQHLLSGTILGLRELTTGAGNSLFFNLFPSPTDADERSSQLRDAWDHAQSLSIYKTFESNVSSLICAKSFELSFSTFKDSLSHKGKKYERLFLPNRIRSLFDADMPKIREYLRNKNGDFFGNVVAEELNIYKSGFSDAFAGFFNIYLDYKLEEHAELDPRIASHGQIATESLDKLGELKSVDYAQGNYWEPSLMQGGGIGAELDKHHPFHILEPENKLTALILALSQEEMSLFDEGKKSTVEEFRFRVSRRLREYSHLINRKPNNDN